MVYGDIVCDRLILKSLRESDCNENYLSWLNDTEVNRFLETRWYLQTIKSIKVFVNDINQSDHSYLFGIFYKESGSKSSVHIGNIKIGPIDKFYSYADISYFVGDRNYWGMGIATDATKAILKFGFEVIGLHRIQAGVFASNIGSIRVLEKIGFVLEGNFRQQLYTKDSCDDHLFYGILRAEWLEKNQQSYTCREELYYAKR
ncbi:MAG: GNAT family protein [Sulfuricurvum sp.]